MVLEREDEGSLKGGFSRLKEFLEREDVLRPSGLRKGG